MRGWGTCVRALPEAWRESALGQQFSESNQLPRNSTRRFQALSRQTAVNNIPYPVYNTVHTGRVELDNELAWFRLFLGLVTPERHVLDGSNDSITLLATGRL